MLWLVLIIGLFGFILWNLWCPPEPLNDDMKRRMGKSMGAHNRGNFGRMAHNRDWYGRNRTKFDHED